jgi:hypothetical protein
MNMEHTESVTSCMTARARYVVYWDSFSDKMLAFLRRRVLSPVFTSVAFQLIPHWRLLHGCEGLRISVSPKEPLHSPKASPT